MIGVALAPLEGCNAIMGNESAVYAPDGSTPPAADENNEDVGSPDASAVNRQPLSDGEAPREGPLEESLVRGPRTTNAAGGLQLRAASVFDRTLEEK